MRFDVRYRTLLTYDALAVDSHNELRARPADTPFQRVVEYQLRVSPMASVRSFVDGWGTSVDSFGVRLPHLAIEVTADATVDTDAPPTVTSLVGIDRLHAESFVDDHYEYLVETPPTAPSDTMRSVAQSLRADAHHVLGLASSLQAATRAALVYEPGVTSVATTAAEAFDGGRGVCQDYAHVMVSLARAAGMPARYVSGYFFATTDEAGLDEGRQSVEVQTHAWVELAIPGQRWMAMDPTNGLVPAERHVKIGHGPDYDAVTPFRGTFVGAETSSVTASVQIRRQNGAPSPAGRLDTQAEDLLRLQMAEAASQDQQQQQQQQ